MIQLGALMRLFGKRRSYSDELALVFDIGSASVGGALVVLDQQEAPRVLYTTRTPMVFQAELDVDRFVSSMHEAFRAVIRDLQEKGMPYVNEYRHAKRAPISRALCVYASPWYTAQTKMLTRVEDKPFTVNQALIDGLVAEEQKAFANEQSSGGGEGHIVEQKVTGIALNGYILHDLGTGRSAEDLRVTMSMTMIAESVIARVEQDIQAVFSVDTIDHHSFGMAGFTVLRNLYSDVSDFLFIDVSGEVTDITCAKDDALIDTVSFPFGARHIIRKLSTACNTDVEHVESLLAHPDQASESARDVLEEALADIRREWHAAFQEALGRLEHESSPEVVYYIADDMIVDTIGTFVTEEYGRAHAVRGVTLRDVVHWSGAHAHDPFIGIATVYCNTLLRLL
mgnify:CR=1 FL=1